MLCEEYVVRRLQDLEEENHGLWQEIEILKKEKEQAEKDKKWLLGLMEIDNTSSSGKVRIKMETLYEEYDGAKFEYLNKMLAEDKDA